MGEVIFGATVACSCGNTTACELITRAMGARCAGVVCTETTGSFSFSPLLQPFATQSIAARVLKSARPLRSEARDVFIVCFMEWLELLAEFANWPEPRDSARLRLDMRR